MSHVRCFLLVTSVCAALVVQVRADTYAPRIGQRHFDFTLPDIRNRHPVSLSDFRGKKLLLIQFASW